MSLSIHRVINIKLTLLTSVIVFVWISGSWTDFSSISVTKRDHGVRPTSKIVDEDHFITG